MKKIITCLIAAGGCQAGWADDLPEFQGEEVVVTATRQQQPISKTLSDVSVITNEQLQRAAGDDLPTVLSRQAGIEIARNGGAGKVTDLFIRGTNSRHAVILIDGMRIVSATNGGTALSQIPVEQIDRIEIVRGPASSLYGADAIGGVIQIFTKKGSGPLAFNGSIGGGDHGTFRAAFGLNGKAESTGTAYSLTVSREQTDGFSATNSDSLYSYNPDNDGYRNDAYNATITQDLAAGHTLGVTLYQSFGRNDYDQSPLGQDREKSRMTGQSVTLKDAFTDVWTSTLRYARTQDLTRNYNNGDMDDLVSKFQTTQNEWTWQNDFDTKGYGSFMLGVDYTDQHVDASTNYDQDSRTTKAVFAGYQGEFGRHLLQGSLRYDDDSQFGGETTGQAAYGFKFTDSWTGRVAYGTAYKAPTFNDLYYPRYGNPNLQPETSENIEAGLKWAAPGSKAELVVFHNVIDNLIIYQDTGSYSRDARIEGVTLSGQTTWKGIELAGNATYQDTLDRNTNRQLARRARAFGDLSASYDWGKVITGVEWQLSGKRYDYPYGVPTQTLGGYGLVNLFADYEFVRDWHVTARVDNIGNKQYTTAYGYNTSGNSWFVSLRYAPN